jgi:hypothetical protein
LKLMPLKTMKWIKIQIQCLTCKPKRLKNGRWCRRLQPTWNAGIYCHPANSKYWPVTNKIHKHIKSSFCLNVTCNILPGLRRPSRNGAWRCLPYRRTWQITSRARLGETWLVPPLSDAWPDWVYLWFVPDEISTWATTTNWLCNENG